jgi:demethoxyubiquinone hydroxylase (CLK1/Coq7/Cat5 family)
VNSATSPKRCLALKPAAVTAPATTEQAPSPALTVLYDGACPLCRREIALYRGLVPLRPVGWLDVSDATAALPAGASPCDRATYLARFHVQQADGQLLSGAAAFVQLWRLLPGWQWLAGLGSLPGATPVLELAYRGFLRSRPAMQRAAASFETPAVPAELARDLIPELRSDHAGETGAVWIYNGVLAVARNPELRAFARRHRDTERQHLARIADVLPWPRRSRLLLPWRLAGFATGALPALFGARAVYGTVAAVETFVDRHYQQQIERLDAAPPSARRDALRALLAECQADECAHRDEAHAARGGDAPAPGWLLRGWCALVSAGSAAAVGIARRL